MAPKGTHSHGDDTDASELRRRMKRHLFEERPAEGTAVGTEEEQRVEDYEGHHADPGEGRPVIEDGLEREEVPPPGRR
jgi:hypothetical protein